MSYPPPTPGWGGPTRAQPTPPPPAPKKDWTKIEAYRPDLKRKLS